MFGPWLRFRVFAFKICLRLGGDILKLFLYVRTYLFCVTAHSNAAFHDGPGRRPQHGCEQRQNDPRRCTPKIYALRARGSTTARFFLLRITAFSGLYFLFVTQVVLSSSKLICETGMAAGRSVACASALKTRSMTCWSA